MSKQITFTLIGGLLLSSFVLAGNARNRDGLTTRTTRCGEALNDKYRPTINQPGQDPEDKTIYKVVVNNEERYSIWPAHRENQLGWQDVGFTGTKEECLAYIKEITAWLPGTPPEQPAPGFKVESKSSDGLSTATFSTPQGTLKVNLPEDRAAGDTISGTVTAEPSGQNETERANNLKQLESFVIEIDGRPVKFASFQNTGSTAPTTVFTTQMLMPPPSVNTTFTTLRDKDGAEKAECLLPIAPTTSPCAPTAPRQFRFPNVTQNGRPLEIVGPFDGNIGTTEVRIGGQPARLLAESPNSCIVQAPNQNFGPTEIKVKENNTEAQGSCRNLGVRLSAPKTSLLRGETTVLTITVEGLKGIQQNVPLLLQKQGVVSMEGGDTQTVQIRPQDVRADGTFETRRTLTGLQAGVFGVTATVIDPASPRIIIPLAENAKVNGFRVKKEGDKFVLYVENVQSPITGKPVDGEHKLEHQCPTLSKIPYVSSLYLNKGNGKADAQCPVIMVTPKIIIQEENE